MTEHEIKVIDRSIEAYRRMIKYCEKEIEFLIAKKAPKCCFEDHIKIKIQTKHRGR